MCNFHSRLFTFSLKNTTNNTKHRLTTISQRDTKLDADKKHILIRIQMDFPSSSHAPTSNIYDTTFSFISLHLHQCGYVTLTFAFSLEFFINCRKLRTALKASRSQLKNLAQIFKSLSPDLSRSRINFKLSPNLIKHWIHWKIRYENYLHFMKSWKRFLSPTAFLSYARQIEKFVKLILIKASCRGLRKPETKKDTTAAKVIIVEQLV